MNVTGADVLETIYAANLILTDALTNKFAAMAALHPHAILHQKKELEKHASWVQIVSQVIVITINAQHILMNALMALIDAMAQVHKTDVMIQIMIMLQNGQAGHHVHITAQTMHAILHQKKEMGNHVQQLLNAIPIFVCIIFAGHLHLTVQTAIVILV